MVAATIIYPLTPPHSKDPANRGIGKCFVNGAVGAATTALISARSILLTTGFFIASVNAGENDGPIGTAALARALAGAGKDVVVVTDDLNRPLVEAALDAALSESRSTDVALEIYPTHDGGTASSGGASPECLAFHTHIRETYAPTVAVAIERPGRTPDGSYRNMRAGDISAVTAPIDAMFLREPAFGFASSSLTTIGVGDGGNEIGMGSPAIRAAVLDAVPDADVTATVVPTDITIATGVSNWGGYALAAGVAALTAAPGLAFPSHLDRAAMDAVNAVGGVDGVRAAVSMSVDDLDWHDHHRPLLDHLVSIATDAAPHPTSE